MALLKVTFCVALLLFVGAFGFFHWVVFFIGWLEDKYEHDEEE